MRESGAPKKCGHEPHRTNERGVALIIVLLVTALLIALIFEFAYGTRVSLRAAVNYRDSERAYYLARSGVNFVGRYLASNLKTDPTGTNHKYDNLQQKEWQTVPFLPGNDAELRVKWDDESAKIRITDVQTNRVRQDMLKTLFENKGVDRSVLDRMMEGTSELYKLKLLTELHRYMNDEEYAKVAPFLTVVPAVNNIDINTASDDVLLSMGISPGAISLINDDRKKEPIIDYTNYSPVREVKLENLNITNYMANTSDIFKVYSYATVGGYTKQVEAIILRNAGGTFTVLNYWRAL